MLKAKGSKFYTDALRRGLTAFMAGLLLMSSAYAGELDAPTESAFAGKIRITELLGKNHATYTDQLGNMPDYIEIQNFSDEAVSLKGFGLADEEDASPWLFPELSLEAGQTLLICADKEDSFDSGLHTDFAISEGETVYLYDGDGLVVDSALCATGTADIAMALDEDGNWAETLYASPGYPNTPVGYDEWQKSLVCTSPLIINEAMVSNDRFMKQASLGYCDWLEIKNVSEQVIELSDYYLSDDDDLLQLWRFPEKRLHPGQCIIVLCDDSTLPANSGYLKAPFKLSAERERVYLSGSDGVLCDYVFLRDIPYDCSYGRIEGRGGWYFFDEPSPGEGNKSGYRRVSAAPVALTADGVFEKGGIMAEISGRGKLYISTDGSVPTVNSTEYTGPIEINSTTILRAVAVEEGSMPSRPLTLSYIIGENHSLPVLSLVTNDKDAFSRMYNNKRKDMEVPGSLSLYEGNSSFTIPGGIEMHGEASLAMPKKNMSFRMSGSYGQDMLSYDAFGGGVTEFTDFIIRSGQDFPSSIVRNELFENLCLQYSDSVPTQRSKHCVLYIDGKYSGLYTLMEKLNEQHYASHYGVDPDTVTVIKARAPVDSSFYQEVILFAQRNDLTKDAAYEQFCEMVDIDSLIDWMIIEGYSSNADISNGNLRYCRSTEGDGKWRFMLFDLDSTMSSEASYAFQNVLRPSSTQCAVFITPLLKNPDFRDKFLSRTAEVLGSTLSDENVVAELDRLAALIAPEVERDYARFGMTLKEWESSIETLRQRILTKKWADNCIGNIKNIMKLSDSEMEKYFGK